jgi:hypothetical protein
MATIKSAYICGPLTELPPEQQASARALYEAVGDVCSQILCTESFVPHQHYDPIANADATCPEVDAAEREQIYHKTSVLVVVAIGPSWGGGIEVEMANTQGVPAIILCNAKQLAARKVSRLLRGNGAVKEVIAHHSTGEMLQLLKLSLRKLFPLAPTSRFRGNGHGAVQEVTQQAGLSH